MFYRRLLKTGQITIPKEIEKELNIKEGQYLSLYKEQGKIFIVKHHSNPTLNQCIYRYSRISLPVELRRLTGFNDGMLLAVNFCKNEQKIIIEG
ncbi:AbrB/MazE/SpoVT family DNA-binding domain-containing protein [Bacillus coreaensis]